MRDIPAEVELDLLREVNERDSLDCRDDELLDHHRTEVYRWAIATAWRAGFEAALPESSWRVACVDDHGFTVASQPLASEALGLRWVEMWRTENPEAWLERRRTGTTEWERVDSNAV